MGVERDVSGRWLDDCSAASLNINDAMQFWIESAQELGQPVPEPKSVWDTLRDKRNG